MGTFTIGGLTGTGNFALGVTVGGNLQAGTSITLQIGQNNASTTYSGVMSGNGGIVKQGSGTLILSGANTFAGSTIISAGAIQINNALALQNSTVTVNTNNGLLFGPSVGTFTIGNLAGTGDFALVDTNSLPITLEVGQNNQHSTYSGTMSGSGAFTKQGNGILLWSGDSTYSGATTVVVPGTLLIVASGGGDPDALLPQRTQADVDLYAWLKTLVHTDFDVPQTAGTAITYAGSGASVRDLYGVYYGLNNSNTSPNQVLLRYPSSAYMLDNGSGEGIEGDGVHIRILAESVDNGANTDAAFFFNFNVNGLSNPFYHNTGLANRLASQAVATMMEINEQANYGSYGSYPEYVGMQMAQSMTAFEATKNYATGMTPALRQSFYSTVNSVVNAWDRNLGPKDANTNMDTDIIPGLALLYKAATAEGLTDLATNARELSAKYLLGSRTATDAGDAPGSLDHYIFHSAGYIGERSQPETSYNGISLYQLTAAAIIVDGVPGWEWLWDTHGVVDRMAKFKSYQIYRDPDGQFNGPSGYAIRTGFPYAEDQSSSDGRDMMVAELSDYGKQQFHKRTYNPTTAITWFANPSLSSVESSIQSKLGSFYPGGSFTQLAPVYTNITTASTRWWPTAISTLAVDYYQPSLYDTLSALITSNSNSLQLPSLRSDQQYNVPFGRNGYQPEFWSLKNNDGYGTDFAAFMESFTRNPSSTNGYSSWRGGGTIQSFWTDKTGLVINSRAGDDGNVTEAWPAVETWITHHLWGTAADNTAFSSAQRDTRISSYTYDSITNPTQFTAFNTPNRATGSYTGTVQYHRTIAKISNGLLITSGLTTSSQDQIKTLWESIPIYVSYNRTTNPVTSIEYWTGSAWAAMPAAETIVTTTKVRLGRNFGSGAAYAYLGFDTGRKIKVASERRANYQAADYFQQLMIDLHPNSGTSQAIAEASITYAIQTTEPNPPTITQISSTKTNGTYGVGEVINITTTFSEPVTSTGNVTLTLETGATDRTCVFAITNSATGSCNYTVQSGDTSLDLSVSSVSGTIKDETNNSLTDFTPANNLNTSKDIVIDTTAPTLSFSNNVETGPIQSDTITADWGDATIKKWDYDTDGTCSTNASDYSKTFSDALSQSAQTNNTKYICLYGEDAAGNKTALASAHPINIDITAPTITSISSDKNNGTYSVGAVIDIDVTFSEPVTSTGNVTVTLETGATDRTCTFTVSNASTGTCNYTVQSGDASSDLSVNAISGSIADQVGNAMVNFTPTTNLAANKALVIDTTLPSITSVSSDKANGSYTVGEVIDIDVNFSEPVTSTGNVTVTLETGATDRTCVFTVSNASTGTCNYTVQSGDVSSDLSVNSISGTIPDQDSNPLVSLIPGTNLADNKDLVIDTTVATIISVSSDKADGSYTVGEVIDIDVTFSEPVTSTGNVTVTLETGVTDRTCTFTVSNASTGTCNYTVQSGDLSSDLTANSISGTIADQAGNAVANFTPAINLAANKALVIDTTLPTITSVSSDKANGAYTVGAVIDIDVTFSEPVTSTGNVTVTLETGATDRTCTFAITNSSTGTCTVQSGDTSSDLSVNAISGVLRDATGNQIITTTPAVNLSANKAIVIDTTAPHLDITSPAPGATVGGESSIVFSNPESVSAQCSLAGVAWSNCVSGVTKLQELAGWGDMSEGAEFSLRISGSDGAGNLGTDIVSWILKSASRQESGYELGVAWNGFLGLTNVLELENRGQESADINLKLYDIDGTRLLERGVSLPAHTSQHFIINDLEGFQRNTYGSVSVEVSAGNPGGGGAGSDIGGQMVFYQFKDNDTLGLNYALPLTRGMSGSSYTVFNTYLPWGGMSESSRIAQWLSVENLYDEAQWFSLNRYDEQGQLLLSSRLYVPARGSRDVEAGHIVPGNNRVGLNELVPDNSSAPYLSHLMRFGGDGSVFEYGLPIVGRRSSDNRNFAVAFSKMLGETNWLEVANVSDTESRALIDCYRSNGDAVGTERAVTLGSKAQVHVNLSESLERGDMGHCVLSPVGASQGLLAQNVIYFPASDGSRSQSPHEVLSYSAEPASESSEHGSYNLYLGMVNWLKIVNLTGDTQSATMNLYQSGSQLSQKTTSIPPHAEVDFGLHEESNYGTRADTYGLVELESQRPQALKSYILRLRPQHGNQGFGAAMQ